MKIMTFNILFGGEDRFDAILAIVAAARPDLLVLQECVGWEDGARLRAVADAVGAPAGERHAVFGRANPRPNGRRNHVVVVSRAPLAQARVHAPETLAHCLVEVELSLAGEPLVVLGTHLNAGSEDRRISEARWLLSLVPPARFAAGLWALVGDLNALSRRDPYPADLDARLATAGIEKYGSPPRFDTMDTLEAFGWTDALLLRPSSSRWATALRGPAGAQVETRTDYVLLSPRLSGRLSMADVIDVDAASDHNAVVADLA
ncbi:endonuclease/exonuclease/phosphatase family protein [Sorangium cellulosum]|uniref:Nuclease n=1 Tax=Sorangium cellulosum TaxID=56 RepID=A0A150QEN1_SORCE|nr:endonuclease/exonuclease/phosphatase family protein [Sorangium cellulosum]KYF66455.1 nuclease [Sorangium cellulosum]